LPSISTSVMKDFVRNEPRAAKRMKALRFSLIRLPGHARELVVRPGYGHPYGPPFLETAHTIRQRIMVLGYAPSG